MCNGIFSESVQLYQLASIFIAISPSLPLFLEREFDIMIHLYGILYFRGCFGKNEAQTPQRIPVNPEILGQKEWMR